MIWSYVAFGAVFAVGLAAILLRGDWQRARGFDKLILFGPIFYAAPLAAFGTEHFTLTRGIAALVPKWVPWHLFWAYFVGACFIAAAFSLVTRIAARPSAALLALTFFLFVVLMDAPGFARHPDDPFALTLALRQLGFSGGALAFFAGLTAESGRRSQLPATIARCFIAIPLLVYSVQQFMRADHVPGIPLRMLTPDYVYGHAMWTYLTAVVYAPAGALLLIGRKTRAAATAAGGTLLVVVLIVYVPIAIVERTDITGLNYMADTLMYCGAILLLAGAMPREAMAASIATAPPAEACKPPLGST
jgi:uncharacterized membrane protein YphA (DoxX/SURF4 family)